APRAPSIKASTMPGFQRLAMMATRVSGWARTVPPKWFMGYALGELTGHGCATAKPRILADCADQDSVARSRRQAHRNSPSRGDPCYPAKPGPGVYHARPFHPSIRIEGYMTK